MIKSPTDRIYPTQPTVHCSEQCGSCMLHQQHRPVRPALLELAGQLVGHGSLANETTAGGQAGSQQLWE